MRISDLMDDLLTLFIGVPLILFMLSFIFGLKNILIFAVVLVVLWLLWKNRKKLGKKKYSKKKKLKRCVKCGKPVQKRQYSFCYTCWRKRKNKHKKKK